MRKGGVHLRWPWTGHFVFWCWVNVFFFTEDLNFEAFFALFWWKCVLSTCLLSRHPLHISRLQGDSPSAARPYASHSDPSVKICWSEDGEGEKGLWLHLSKGGGGMVRLLWLRTTCSWCKLGDCLLCHRWHSRACISSPRMTTLSADLLQSPSTLASSKSTNRTWHTPSTWTLLHIICATTLTAPTRPPSLSFCCGIPPPRHTLGCCHT